MQKKSFEIDENFILNGEPFKIISGAVHYFRIVPEYWEHTLYNLKALGCNTVETYVPWNIHEPKEGSFNFDGLADLPAFIELAEEMGLYVILRPTPYVCAEWEFGGLPAWLLKDSSINVRTDDSKFIQKVDQYFEKLLKIVTPYQITNNGPILMMQLENEYGSYGNNKNYMREILDIMRKNNVNVPIFTSDGSWDTALEAGSLIEEDILVTANFGSDSKVNLEKLEKFHNKYNKKWPLMCMEFWDGWFNRWGDEIVKRDPKEFAEETRELLKIGSLNFYMFQGGTNFGFMNSSSARKNEDFPQVTSYDYDALLTEWGEPTEKYYEVQKVIKDVCPEVKQMKPRTLPVTKIEDIPLTNKVSLHETLNNLAKPINKNYTKSMEDLGQNYGYILYRTKFKTEESAEKLKVVEASDRIHIFLNEEKVATQYKEEIGEEIILETTSEEQTLDILVENLGRVNYGHKLIAPSQRKGIRSGVMLDHHYRSDWDHYLLPLENIEEIDFTKPWHEDTPAFYEFTFDQANKGDMFIDCSEFGKGVVFINGFNLGRFWNKGPVGYLYLPEPLLKPTNNKIIFFETEGIWSETLTLNDSPIYIEQK